MSRPLTAREVADILGVSSKTVREWANEGVLRGVKTDNGPGKETWEFVEEEIYSCTDAKVVNRLKPGDVAEHRNASLRIEDLEREIEGLKASLTAAEESLRESKGVLAGKDSIHEQETAGLKKDMDRCEDASFAVADAMKAVIEAISLKRDLEELFRGANIRVKHRMADDLESWHLCYTIQGRNARYEMEEFKYRPERPLEGLNRYLLTTEAGEFHGCHDPSKERLQARRKLYGLRLRVLASFMLIFLLLLMSFGKVTLLPVSILIALGVTALVVVDSIYRVRIWIRKGRAGEKS